MVKSNKLISKLIRLLDPLHLVSLHNHILIRRFAQTGHNVRITYRADIFNHSRNPSQLILGNHVLIDGTLEVYKYGQLSIGSHTSFGRSRIYASNCVQIGSYCLISDNVSIMDSNLHPTSASARRYIAEEWAGGKFPDVYTNVTNAPVIIEDDSWLGFGCCILKGVTIGQGAIVGANSVVLHDVEPYTIVAGNPATVIREIPEHER